MEDFQVSIGQIKQAQGGVMGGLSSVWMVCVCFFLPKGTKEEKECVRKNISFYVWKKVVHGKNMCKQRAWKEVVCNK
jgi:hypothetical protein